MKLLNYDERTLILENVRPVVKNTPETYTKSQYLILCNLIRQKHISEQFFKLILSGLYDLQNWKELNYEQMYELIHVLTYFDYTKKGV